MGDIPHMLSLPNIEEIQKQTPLQKSNWLKIVICTDLCLTRYITYMHTCKTGLDQIVK